ncbi:tudor domain-containing protein [Sinorhizobium mexicanum]|uniref:Uncharacterized protein n=1 Tax=Sinorhizobium mexicanum TaxID=375549 RepID=A0A859QNC0_9HYPH|nr:tudor domain-containing protein [Sinorhizobium mexicanum]MBP1885731.1 hypothetical protein [Sinorhizobium mexicanum]QLL63467.1 hypothetical protein FKV68_19475 [Sinorhizobium mexicanum]
MHILSTSPLTPHATITLAPVSILGAAPSATLRNNPKANAAAAQGPDAKVIVIGLDDQGRPHASWFAEDECDAAAVASDLMNMALIDVSNEELAAIANNLPRGKLFESGKAFVPFVKRTTYDQLAKYLDDDYLAAAAARVEAAAGAASAAAEDYAKASKGEVPARQPEDWSKLLVGDLVLARETAEEGWFEAIVVELAADGRFRLRWRDWPELPNFTRALTDIALLHPKHVAA